MICDSFDIPNINFLSIKLFEVLKMFVEFHVNKSTKPAFNSELRCSMHCLTHSNV